jgi:hypothetical protein
MQGTKKYAGKRKYAKAKQYAGAKEYATNKNRIRITLRVVHFP